MSSSRRAPEERISDPRPRRFRRVRPSSLCRHDSELARARRSSGAFRNCELRGRTRSAGWEGPCGGELASADCMGERRRTSAPGSLPSERSGLPPPFGGLQPALAILECAVSRVRYASVDCLTLQNGHDPATEDGHPETGWEIRAMKELERPELAQRTGEARDQGAGNRPLHDPAP